MKKILLLLGLIATGPAPLAASAHTDVRVGIDLGAPRYAYRVPAYYDYGTVVTTRPYCPPHRVIYEDYDDYRPYTRVEYRDPVVIYRAPGHWHRWHEHDRWH